MSADGEPRAARPWTEHGRLSGLLAGWRPSCVGRALFTVTAGPQWVRLHLEGDARDGILLADVPGALVVAACQGRLPEPLAAALPARRDHPLRTLLAGARLDALGLLPDDRVAAFRFTAADGTTRVLLHRMFGPRGDTVLLHQDGRLLWARHRPPLDLLTRIPPPATWTGGEPADDDLSAPALDHLAACLADQAATAHAAAVGRRLRSAERLAANLEADLAVADRGAALRREAETLAAHLHELVPGQAVLEAPCLSTGEPLRIALDPALPPAANLDAAFRRARKAEKGRAVIAGRLAQARAEEAQLAAVLAAAAALPAAPPLARLAAVLAWVGDAAATADGKPAAVPRAHAPDEPARPFRRYRIDGRWEVWVGRSNVENDELTHRASHGLDIWLHAQGVSGSHVILRTGGHPEHVPRAVIEKAASLAALHSKARHAGLVPVIWTERRHVRKPRKAPPGTAVCQREKSVFVAPGVPAGAEPA
ncbi:MAG TPA: NFACT RNA binding domain-containing protein [Candidatus Krumholzibacteria bacterium]|nr:NFACT RNA binding domain-containing protein [Candidatus Krumholzibacteria bacterium]